MYSNLLPGESVIMPWQSRPFNNDHFICEKFLELKKKFNIDTIIECGCAMGGTTKWFGECFDHVTATEINHEFLEFAQQRTEGLENIAFVLGNTIDNLETILLMNSSNMMLFLDDHWNDYLPLPDELRIIAEVGMKPVIAIHDFKVPGHPELGFDKYNNQPFTWEWIKPSIERIYGVDGYEIEYNTTEKSAGAKRGIIYIMPKQ